MTRMKTAEIEAPPREGGGADYQAVTPGDIRGKTWGIFMKNLIMMSFSLRQQTVVDLGENFSI